jgi:predicted Zn finger-like uncharacterized protein
VVVICPKCRTRLKVAEERLTVGGSRFKCPKCNTLLFVKKPSAAPERPVDNFKIIVAHSNPAVMSEITSLLHANSYQTVIAGDGIEAMVKAVKELPFIAILEVGLPKIYGFEVCKRLKGRPETKGMKFILVSSPYDKKRYKREPASLYEADDYIEEHQISDVLMNSINSLRGSSLKAEEKKERKMPAEQPLKETGPETTPRQIPDQKPESAIVPEAKISQPQKDENIERARRLARTILSDIYLYNVAKADDSIKNDTFSTVFASELREGIKLYENRIPEEIRAKGDFFKETIKEFIENKKRSL